APPQPAWGGNAGVANNGWDAQPAPQPPPPAPMPPPAPRPAAKVATPPPSNIEGVRPRIVSSAKVQNAAAASLRQSAAVGENYLNELLTGGLLDVAGVRVPEQEYDLRPDRRWGRSTRRAFIFLFVVLVVGIGGGGTWYWWSEKQTAEAVGRLQKEAKVALANSDYGGFTDALGKLADALKKNSQNSLTWAYTAEVAGLTALLYGTPTQDSDEAYKQVKDDIPEGEPGYRELVIGHAAVGLARVYDLPQVEKGAKDDPRTTALNEVAKYLDTHLGKTPDDKWLGWLRARAHLELGERKAARTLFKTTSDGTDGLLVAKIDLAHMMIDEGEIDDALKLVGEVDAKVKNHPLAVLAGALARAESYLDTNPIFDALAVPTLADAKVPHKIRAYKSMVLALANLTNDEHPAAAEELQKAISSSANTKPPGESRFVARIAWIQYVLGDLEKAVLWRTRIGKKPEPDPTTQLVMAGLELAAGVPDRTLALAKNLAGTRARLLKAQAWLDKGQPKEALAEAVAIQKFLSERGAHCTEEDNKEIAKGCRHALLISTQAALMTAPAKERDKAEAELKSQANPFKTKIGKHALGVARRATGGDLDDARRAFEQALDICPQNDCTLTATKYMEPNPIAYRTFTALAEIAVANKDLPLASKYLNWVLNGDIKTRPELQIGSTTKITAVDDKNAPTVFGAFLRPNLGYVPAKLMMAKVLVRDGNAEQALPFLEEVLAIKDLEPTMDLQLTQAEVYASSKKEALTAKATELLKALKGKPGAPDAELGRIASLIDPKLPKELDLPDPAGGKDEKKDPKKK
ncbi:MAG: hypothetical protein KIT31_37420, partial [Deltaproteobacteria bacterium]|nr:hypothetical protein [Deltaproteobacteria bacterium]